MGRDGVRAVLAVVAAALLVSGFQLRTTPGAGVIGHSESLSRQPVPVAPPVTVPRPESVWVPDRYLPPPPGEPGMVYVPGHWEQRITPNEHVVPALPSCNTATGNCVTVPGGSRQPPELRQSP